jgi:predicted phage gp36 major capsid-like protein
MAEAIEAASAALWNVAHEHDSLSAGRTWETAREDARFTHPVAHMRWKAETAIRAADKVRANALSRALVETRGG